MIATREIGKLAAAAVILALVQGRGWSVQPDAGETPARVKKAEDLKFKHKSFTFVRVKHSEQSPQGKGKRWMTDYPDSDRKIAARFAKETGLKTDPEGKALELRDAALKQYPFIYMVEAGLLELSEAEAASLRNYLLGGGFLMVDDFWGEQEWKKFYENIKRVFPEREPKELPIEHPIFHCYYDLKQKPQVPSIHAAFALKGTGKTSERLDAPEPHYQGITDDKGRLMVIICHNTDLGDGWERDDVDDYYSREFSQKKAYPMGINILIYALTQ
jgi:hypothetical protein